MKITSILFTSALLLCGSTSFAGVAENNVGLQKLKNGSYALCVKSNSSVDFSAATKKWHEVAKSTCEATGYKIGFLKESPSGSGDAYIVDKYTGKGRLDQVPSFVFGSFICLANS